MNGRRYQCFRKNQKNSDEQPIVSIKLSLTEDRKDNPHFQKDMSRLVNKICFSDNQDSEIVEFLATDFGDPNLRQYELFPTFSDTNVSVDARKPLRGVYSNSEEIQLNIWRTGYTIRYNNSK